MAADNPVDPSGTGPSTDGEAQAPTAADALPLAALALAADPILAPTLYGDAPAGAAPVALADATQYDGHVALALDADALPALDSMLDLLVTSHDLFEIPAIDSVSPLDDSTPT
jgi:hypothetical protein